MTNFDDGKRQFCLVFNPTMVEGYAALFSCTAVVQAGFDVKLEPGDCLWLDPPWFN